MFNSDFYLLKKKKKSKIFLKMKFSNKSKISMERCIVRFNCKLWLTSNNEVRFNEKTSYKLKFKQYSDKNFYFVFAFYSLTSAYSYFLYVYMKILIDFIMYDLIFFR